VSNLSRYTNLHRMTTDLNVDAQIDVVEGDIASEDRQVIAAVGASVMALGMGMVEAAGGDYPEAMDNAVANLLDLSATLAPVTANGLEALRANVPEALDGDDVAMLSIMGMGLREVAAYQADRREQESPVDEEEPID
jgi:hypothetical protein